MTERTVPSDIVRVTFRPGWRVGVGVSWYGRPLTARRLLFKRMRRDGSDYTSIKGDTVTEHLFTVGPQARIHRQVMNLHYGELEDG